MAREILFRGFHSCENGRDKVFVDGEWIKGEWVEGYYFEQEERSFIMTDTYPIDEEYTCMSMRIIVVEVIPETVGEYADLTDKNDKKIFEGDIIKIGNKIRFVFYGMGAFRHTNYGEYAKDLSVEYANNCEVIGKIYDSRGLSPSEIKDLQMKDCSEER